MTKQYQPESHLMNQPKYYSMLRVATAVPTVKVADPYANVNEHIQLIRKAEESEVGLLVFPELSLTGYTCGDLFFQPQLLRETIKALDVLLCQTREIDAVIIVGMPLAIDNHLYNTAVAIQHGKIRAIIPKTFLPNYGEFNEKRWFASASEVAPQSEVTLCGMDSIPFGPDILLDLGDAKVGIEICEDLWAPIPVSSRLALNGAEIIVNLSASDEVLGKHDYLKKTIESQSGRLSTAYLYASAGMGESTSDLVFAGKGIIAENGSIIGETKRFSMASNLLIRDIDTEKLQFLRRTQNTFVEKDNSDCKYRFRIVKSTLTRIPDVEKKLYRHIDAMPFVPQGTEDMAKRCDEIFNIQVSALLSRLQHIRAQSAIIGISGGLDSTLALLVTVKAFDRLGWSRDRIIGITMPGFGTSNRTYNNSIGLMTSLGISQREISIVPGVLQHFKDLGIDSNIHDITYENSQARERTQILMDAANQANGIVIGTGDLSELALGWCTYNGDHMSMYAVNAGVPKTLVKHLVKWIATTQSENKTRDILLDIVDTPISPELIPTDADGNIAQKTEDLVGPYELHDFFLYHFFHFGASPAKLYFLARKAWGDTYSPETLKKWIRNFFHRFFSQQFKRSCIPDGPKVGSVCLSPRGDWRMPSDAQVRIWADECNSLDNL